MSPILKTLKCNRCKKYWAIALTRTLARDVFEAFSNAARGAVDVEINPTALRSVNNSLLGGG